MCCALPSIVALCSGLLAVPLMQAFDGHRVEITWVILHYEWLEACLVAVLRILDAMLSINLIPGPSVMAALKMQHSALRCIFSAAIIIVYNIMLPRHGFGFAVTLAKMHTILTAAANGNIATHTTRHMTMQTGSPGQGFKSNVQVCHSTPLRVGPSQSRLAFVTAVLVYLPGQSFLLKCLIVDV